MLPVGKFTYWYIITYTSTYLKRDDYGGDTSMEVKSKVFIINGKPGIGKDTFIDIIKQFSKNIHGKIECNSSVDIVKDAAELLGWDDKFKTDKDRKFLADLKDLSTKYNDCNFKYLEKLYNEFTSKSSTIGVNEITETPYVHSIFFMIREPDEIERAKKEFNAKTILITGIRDDMHKVDNNDADKNVENYKYDYIIDNSGSLDDFKKKAITFLMEELVEYNK